MANEVVSAEEYFEFDGLLGEIRRQLRQKSGYPYDSERLRNTLKAVTSGNFLLPHGVSVDTLPAVIDYDRPIIELIDAGRYDFVGENIKDLIRKLDPARPTGKIKSESLKLVHLHGDPYTADAYEVFEAIGLRRADFRHLLTLGTEYPNLQLYYQIVAPNSNSIDCPFLSSGLWDSHRLPRVRPRRSLENVIGPSGVQWTGGNTVFLAI
ncbi:MAG: hypothetical protein AAB897_03225 [Patescibacteria group bacterium]